MPAARKSSRRSRRSRPGKSLKGLAKGAMNVGSRAVRGTVRTAKNTVTKTAANTARAATETVDFARNFSKDVVDALETVVNGLINGAGSVVDTAGSVTENVLTDLFDVKATHVFKGAGKLAKQLADNIGGVVRQIPYVGNATGYVVESAGGGVFHVILSVGKLIGSTSRRLGRVAKKTTDLVVFTLHAGRDQIKDTAVSVDDIIDRVGNSLVGRSRTSAKTLKGAGGMLATLFGSGGNVHQRKESDKPVFFTKEHTTKVSSERDGDEFLPYKLDDVLGNNCAFQIIAIDNDKKMIYMFHRFRLPEPLESNEWSEDYKAEEHTKTDDKLWKNIKDGSLVNNSELVELITTRKDVVELILLFDFWITQKQLATDCPERTEWLTQLQKRAHRLQHKFHGRRWP